MPPPKDTPATPHRPYYVHTSDYTRLSAGIRAMHLFCHYLNEAGEEAYVSAQTIDDRLKTPRLTNAIVARHWAANIEPIAVYPEIVHGNPFQAKSVVRYLLNYPGLLSGPKTFDPSDMLVFYHREYAYALGLRTPRLVRIPMIDTAIFNNADNPLDDKRKGKLIYPGRYVEAQGKHPALFKDATVITGDWPSSHEELAHLFRSSEVLYCFANSAVVSEALLCGCPVVLMDSPFSRRPGNLAGEFASASTLGVGIVSVDAPQAIAQAKLDTAKFISQHRLAEDAFKNQLSGFIAASQALPVISSSPPLAEERSKRWEPGLFHLIVLDAGHPLLLAQTLQSVAGQWYDGAIVTVVSPDPAPGGLAAGKLEWLATDTPPAQLASDIIAKSPAKWCGVIRAGDQLAPGAMFSIAGFIQAHPDCVALYTDEDVIGPDGSASQLRFKPDFDIELLRSAGYVGGLLLARKESWIAVGGWRPLPPDVDGFDAALRLSCGAGVLGHVPGLLYHRYRVDSTERDEATVKELKRCVLDEHLRRCGVAATAIADAARPELRVDYACQACPLVSVVIPTRDNAPMLQRCIESLLEKTAYPNLEFLVVDNGSVGAEARAFVDGLAQIAPDKIRVFSEPGPFDFAAINNRAAKEARGDYLLLLNDDIAALHANWLDVLMARAQQPDVGIVGGRLVFPSGNIQHVGVVLGLNGVADFAFSGAPMDAPGPLGMLQSDREVSAVTGACLLIRREVFDEVGGMDDRYLKVAYGDFDLCLKVRQAGYRIVWTPHATLMHDAGSTLKRALADPQAAARESARFAAEQETFYLRWREELARDPYYNPNLSLSSRTFEIETRAELAPDPIDWHPLPNVAALPGDLHGSGHYRIIDPARRAHDAGLARSRVLHGYPEPVVFERLDIDVLVSQRQVDDAQIAAVERMKRLSRCRIVMDFDDLLTHVPEYSSHKKDVWQDMQPRLERLCRGVDRVTVSTAPLAEHMRRYHGDVRAVPNGIDARRWSGLRPLRSRSGRPRVGWVGGSAHAGDLALIRDVVRQLADEVEWVFMGLYLEEMKPYLTEIHPGVPFEQYPAKMAALDLDLALAPLAINAFNECKSNLRVLEYGVLGIPVIATDIEPYRGDLPIRRVANRSQDWLAAIREYLADPGEMQRQGEALRQKVLSAWMLDHQMPAWLDAWTF